MRNDSIWDYVVFRKIQVRIVIEIQFSAFLIDKQFAHTAPFIEWPRVFFFVLFCFLFFEFYDLHRASSCCFRAL